MIITRSFPKMSKVTKYVFMLWTLKETGFELSMRNFLQGGKTLDSTGINSRLWMCNSNNPIQISPCYHQNVTIWPFNCILSSWIDFGVSLLLIGWKEVISFLSFVSVCCSSELSTAPNSFLVRKRDGFSTNASNQQETSLLNSCLTLPTISLHCIYCGSQSQGMPGN